MRISPDPRLADFTDNLALVNDIAERSPGFIWRYNDESGNATASSHRMTFTTVMVSQLGRRLKTAPIAKMIPSRIAKTKQMPMTPARRAGGDIEGAKTGA